MNASKSTSASRDGSSCLPNREFKAVYKELKQLLPDQVRIQEPMSQHTTFRIGGPADILVEPRTIAALRETISYAKVKNIPVFVMGAGSNLLIRDGGIRGMVVKIGRHLARIKIDGVVVMAEAGATLSHLALTCCQASLAGFEFAVGIPGTVGGAVVMNAGAEGRAMSDVVQEVLVLNQKGCFDRLKKEDLGFGYRSSNLLDHNQIVVEVVCQGTPDQKERIQERQKKHLHHRQNTQPLMYPNAGSVFKNPPGFTAGYLIEQAGAKGRQIGAAKVSLKHANFIINLGMARAKEVQDLISEVQEVVKQRFGIQLALEIQIVGED
jgi:UDP-N-acetylmuramate dehydrogenase